MKDNLRIALLCIVISFPIHLKAQRLSDNNTIGWMASLNTIHIKKSWSLWLEYQWRRENLVTDWQQSLFRTGIQYQFKNGISALVGYGYIITYPYGDYPAGTFSIPEHRIFQQLSWNDVIGRVGLNHRIRIEQRYLGKVDQKATQYEVNDWIYLNRMRYQLRATIALNKKRIEDGSVFLAAYDELFIGWGKNVNQNIFDQNRIGLLLGYQFNKNFRAEAGFLNQTVQQAAEINNREVYQYNNGVIVNIYTNLFN